MFIRRSKTKNKNIKIGAANINYTLKTSGRAKVMRLAVYRGGALVATRPFWLSEKAVEGFIIRKADWIISAIERFKKSFRSEKEIKGEYREYKESALALAEKKIEYYNRFYNFSFNRVTVRNQRTRWGSCSKKGNLNFNYKIALIEERLADYIIVHELCHLKEFNHSEKFWELVSKAIPDYIFLRKKLKTIKNG